MQTEKISVAALAGIVFFSAWLPFSAAALAQQPSEPNCRWQAGFAQRLGIDPVSEPADGQPVEMLKATVGDPDRLYALGLFAARRGDQISMLCVGSDVWRIKHYATGRAITFSTRPF